MIIIHHHNQDFQMFRTFQEIFYSWYLTLRTGFVRTKPTRSNTNDQESSRWSIWFDWPFYKKVFKVCWHLFWMITVNWVESDSLSLNFGPNWDENFVWLHTEEFQKICEITLQAPGRAACLLLINAHKSPHETQCCNLGKLNHLS